MRRVEDDPWCPSDATPEQLAEWQRIMDLNPGRTDIRFEACDGVTIVKHRMPPPIMWKHPACPTCGR